ncbi:MAG: bifunctional homocysteine S-methyltransferase/methylenetetrahydrofolate reductase [Spirochaetales bacterium]|nr:bifunctional homocysteine S-methyltransferase/methylenetetrahydrofolate reductase [Spirochaetales bacterium]
MPEDYPFLKQLDRTVIIADGAMGTMVQQVSADPVECVEQLNLTQPALIEEIHTEYVKAGSGLIETNTFAANRFMLEKVNLSEKVSEINRAAVQIARRASGAGIFVAGSMGPLLHYMEELQEDLLKDYRKAVEEQAAALIDEKADLLILETYGNLTHLLASLDTVRGMTGVPVIASLTLSRSGMTYDGFDLYSAGKKLMDAGADVLGLNCGYGINAIEEVLESPARLEIPLSVMPNAGLPERVGARFVYGVSPDYFAKKAESFVSHGARIIGGCCGTTPAHIERAALLLKEKKIVRRAAVRYRETAVRDETAYVQGAFLDKVADIKPAVICEIDPPGGLDLSVYSDAIDAVSEAGADAVSMAENPLASIRVENLAFAALVKRRIDVPVILHVTGRDRNLLGLQSFFLGAHVLGIEGLLCVTGDPSHVFGPTNVFDVDSVGLIKMAAGLNKGRKLWGKDLPQPTRFSIGCAFNPGLGNNTFQLKKLKKKIDAGARFVMTQPLFEKDKIVELMETTRNSGARIFAGIFPIISSRAAEYLHNEVPGISIPENLRILLSRNSDKEYQQSAGIEQAMKLVQGIYGLVDGIYLISPHTKPLLLADMVRFIKGGCR